MKATRKLLKDLTTAALGFGIFWLFLSVSGNAGDSGSVVAFWVGSGLLFGWKYVSKIFVAWSLWGIAAKFILSAPVGMVVFPVTMLADTINVIREFRTAREC